MVNSEVAVILYGFARDNRLAQTLQSITDQVVKPKEVYLITDDPKFALPDVQPLPDHHIIVAKPGVSSGTLLNQIIQNITAPLILLINNLHYPVTLSRSALACMRQHMIIHPETVLIYGDYTLDDDHRKTDLRLLKHHPGRLRDNQDYGLVYLIRTDALREAGGFDEELRTNVWYDARLKLAEKGKLVHIANKYGGALYQVYRSYDGQNVFDYLLASRESQLEAEQALTGHLKRIGASLEPDAHYKERPQPSPDLELEATIIIPVNHRPEFISTAIESVQAQTVSNIEVIVVVNGGGNDPTIPEVQRYMEDGDRYQPGKPAVQLLIHDINNIGFCLNMGVMAAKGKYYVQLDSDDRLKPDAVEKILQIYKSDPTIGMVIGSYEVWEKVNDGSLRRVESMPVVTHDEWTADNGRNNLLRINGAGAPRSAPIALLRHYPFGMNEEPYTRNYGEDYDLVLRISERYRIGRVWEPIYEVVRHAGGTDHSIDQQTVDLNDEAKDWMRWQALKRRRSLNAEK